MRTGKQPAKSSAVKKAQKQSRQPAQGKARAAKPAAAAQTLSGLRYRQLGSSRVGRMLASLLAQQGAREASRSAASKSTASNVTAVDILIDDRTDAPVTASDIDAWRKQHPTGVYVRFTDFPRAHPRASDRSTLNDELIHAELGLNRIAGQEPDAEPLAMASAYGAIWASVYIAAALMRRDATRRGDTLVVPLFSAGLTVLARRLIGLADPACVDPLTVPHLPLAEIYRCADGRYVQSQGHSGRFVEALMTAAGRMEWSDAASKGLHRLPDRATEAMWAERMTAMFLEKPAMEWERAINELGGACTVCRTDAEWRANEHARAAQIIAAPGGAGRPADAGPGVRIVVSDELPRAKAQAVRPLKGEAANGAEKSFLPLAGVRVVDFAIILAGPTCGRTLSELGADVIKVDAAVQPTSMFGWLDVNRGKRSIAIDLKRPAGLAVAHRLVAAADVVVENFRAGKLEALGLGFADAARLRPGIVYASLNAFDFGGPWAGRAGWEHNAQAASGMQVARAKNGVAKAVPVPVNDYSTGLLGASGVLLALREARASGRAVWVGGSLARSATLIRDDQLFAKGGAKPLPTRVQRCADGWLRVLLETRAQGNTLSRLAPSLAAMDRAGALQALRAAGITAAPERTVAELLAEESIDNAGLRVKWDHPRWGPLWQVTAAAEATAIANRAGWPAPDPGEDSVAILGDLGYSEAEIDLMLKMKVVSGRVPLFNK